MSQSMRQINYWLRQLIEPVTAENEANLEQVAIQIGEQDAALPAIETLLAHSNADVRFWGVRALWANGNATAQALLMRCLYDKEEIVRSGAALALGELRSETSILALMELLVSDTGSAGDHAADALSKIGQAAAESLNSALSDKRSYIRIRATKALTSIQSQAAIPELIRCWETDESYLVRHYAEIALKRMGVGEMIYFD